MTPTPWQDGGMVLGLVAYAVAGIWGGRPERTAGGVLLVVCLLSGVTYRWEVNGFYPAGMAQDCVRFLIFGWLCFRADRWSLLVMTAAHGLLVMVYGLRLLDPAFSHVEMASAHVGLGYLIDLTLLFGVLERWLAGERPAGPAAWAAAERVTAARRGRGARPPGTAKRSTLSGPARPGQPAESGIP